MSEHVLNVSIVTPQATAFEGTALAVSVPGSQSPFQVLYNHAPIISSLDIGVVKIEDEKNNVTYYASREGFVEVMKNTVNIVVQELVPAASINLANAEQQLTSARAEADAHPDRAHREVLRREVHWAEAQIRAAKLVSGQS
jgi:F-type H+-transporting ATPase subunit epsilon